MPYVPINGLRLLAVETSILLATAIFAFLFLRFVARSISTPRWLEAILVQNSRAVVFVIGLALVGRAAFLPWVGVPQPRVNDEFSYLLMGDTFAHFRLANPTPAAWRHFETFHVNLTPTYHSKYPVSQGLVLGFGELVFHQPWVGIYLSTAAMCGAICWALQAFVSPGWALVGGLLAVFRLAFFSYWMNSYWGGSMAALGGAVALGAIVRLFEPSRSNRSRVTLSCLFGLSLLILATSRPYEGFAFALPLLVYFAYKLAVEVRRHRITLRSTAVPVCAIGLAGLSWMGYYNHRTTGNALLLPHILNERVYSPLPLFLWQRPKPSLTFRDPVFAKFFEVTQHEYEYQNTKTVPGILQLEVSRFLEDWLFYCGPALSIPALIGIFSVWKQGTQKLAVLVAASTAIALALCTYTMFHYAAPATITLFVFATEGLHYLWEQRTTGEQAFVVAVCLTTIISCTFRQTGSAAINSKFALPDNRALIQQKLAKQPGKQLVLVSYDLERHYPGDELVHNWADIRSQKVLWARSKGPGHDNDLCAAYGDRTFWSVTTDDRDFSLTPLDLCGRSRSLLSIPKRSG